MHAEQTLMLQNLLLIMPDHKQLLNTINAPIQLPQYVDLLNICLSYGYYSRYYE